MTETTTLNFLDKNTLSEPETLNAQSNDAFVSFGDNRIANSTPIAKGDETSQLNVELGSMVAEFYTDIGSSLYRGQPLVKEGEKVISNSRMGLTKFDKILGEIYQSARQDDPFADQLILDIEKQMDIAVSVIQRCDEYIEQVKKQKTGMIGVYCEIKPPKETHVFNVFLRTPIAASFFWSIKQADSLSLVNLFCRKRQIIPREESRKISMRISQEINKLYSMVKHFRFTGVTRNDIIERNQRAVQAGILNQKITLTEEVLSKKVRSTYAPIILINSTTENTNEQSDSPQKHQNTTPAVQATQNATTEIQDVIVDEKA